MPFKENIELKTKENKETLGHIIEKGVIEFLDSGVFDCIEHVQKTAKYGANDGRGIDVVVEFVGGDKLAIDITTVGIGPRALKKLKDTNRNLMASIVEEKNNEGEVIVDRQDLIPRVIIGVDPDRWEEYCDVLEDENGTVLLHMSLEQEKEEKEKIINKMIEQINNFSRQHDDYRKKAISIKKVLHQELDALEREAA